MAGPQLDGLINPEVLVWAREQSCMDQATAASKVGQTPERLAEWESGQRVPTLNQLRSLAELYKRSVGVFFLRERPQTRQRVVDYRRLDLSLQGAMSAPLAHGLREAEAKRDAALDILAQREETAPDWSLRLAADVPAELAAEVIEEYVGLPIAARKAWRTPYDALNGWRGSVERRGVMVIQLSGVPVEEMRGCSLALFPLPVIVLNGADSPLGRVFTLLHELVHLARSESGLCDFRDDALRAERAAQVEVYCNWVAGVILLPERELLKIEEVRQADMQSVWSADFLAGLSRRFWVSREAVLRRLLDIGKTSRGFYQEFRQRLRTEYANKQNGGFVPYHRRVVLSNGRVLTRIALDAYDARVITGTELSRVLNAKLDHLPSIQRELEGAPIA